MPPVAFMLMRPRARSSSTAHWMEGATRNCSRCGDAVPGGSRCRRSARADRGHDWVLMSVVWLVFRLIRPRFSTAVLMRHSAYNVGGQMPGIALEALPLFIWRVTGTPSRRGWSRSPISRCWACLWLLGMRCANSPTSMANTSGVVVPVHPVLRPDIGSVDDTLGHGARRMDPPCQEHGASDPCRRRDSHQPLDSAIAPAGTWRSRATAQRRRGMPSSFVFSPNPATVWSSVARLCRQRLGVAARASPPRHDGTDTGLAAAFRQRLGEHSFTAQVRPLLAPKPCLPRPTVLADDTYLLAYRHQGRCESWPAVCSDAAR